MKKPWDDPRYFFGGPTFAQASRIAWDDIKDLTPKEWISDISESARRLKTVFGSTVWCIGLDQPQRVEGVGWDGCILDESSDLKPGTFDRTVYPALADRKGWCWRIGVPKRFGLGAKEFKRAFEAALAGTYPQGEAFHWTSKEILDEETILHAARTLDAKTYNEQFNATFETSGGAAYENFTREYHVRHCEYNPHRPILVGCDFNVDPMSWVLCHHYLDLGRLEVFDELWIRGTTTQKSLDLLWDRYKSHDGGWEFYGDATSQARHTSAAQSDYQTIYADKRFRQSGRTVHFPSRNPAVIDRLRSVDALLLNGVGERRLFIDPRCEKLIESLEDSYLKPGTRDLMKSGDEHDVTHPGDGLGYIVHYLFPINPLDEEEMNDGANFGVDVIG